MSNGCLYSEHEILFLLRLKDNEILRLMNEQTAAVSDTETYKNLEADRQEKVKKVFWLQDKIKELEKEVEAARNNYHRSLCEWSTKFDKEVLKRHDLEREITYIRSKIRGWADRIDRETTTNNYALAREMREAVME